ncbi:MAG: MBL fold metallo-hydrolase [Deltaproteobacteria bacterium]|nr:MBL fold metallo-hydrolase [Deltaproteobacteria bacterium]
MRRAAFNTLELFLIGAIACGTLAVDSVAPTSGLNTQATQLSIRGSGFESSATVKLGETTLAIVSVANGEIRATVPAGLDAGLFDVTVNLASTKSARLTNAYRVVSSSLRIVAVDVGQGDATLVISPTGSVGVIDQGRPGSGAKIQAAMTRLGATTIDWILVTHYDSDHFAGALEIPLPTIAYDRGEPAQGTATYQNYKTTMGSRRRTVSPGDVFDLGGGTALTVVAVGGRLLDGGVVATSSTEENENSIGVVLSHGKFRMFQAGDLTGPTAQGETDVETALGLFVPDVDIYHVSHHGSTTSSSDTFIRKLKPEVALISAGLDNSYCHPAPSVLNRLSNEGVTVYATTAGIVTPDAGCAVTSFPAGSRVLNGDIDITTVTGDTYTVAGDPRNDDGAP